MEKRSILSLQNILMEKLLYLKDMLELTKAQSETIENEEIEVLDNLIDKKSALISKIDLLDCKFKDSKGEVSLEDKTLLEIKSQIEKVLIEIKTVDDENNKNLSIAMAEMKLNLKDIRQGQRAMKNYGNSDPYQSFVSQGGTLFIDQDS